MYEFYDSLFLNEFVAAKTRFKLMEFFKEIRFEDNQKAFS